MSENLQRLCVDLDKKLNIRERIKASAKRHRRSINKHVEVILENYLEMDELSKEQQIVVEDVKREIVQRMLR